MLPDEEDYRPLTDLRAALTEKIRTGDARVGTLGLGYVGLPLSVEFASAGLNVTGFDLSAEKTGAINQGRSYIKDVPDEKVAACVRAGRLRATTDFDELADCDAVVICVPTPLNKTKDPDLTIVVDAAKAIAAAPAARGSSWSWRARPIPGTTEELILPLLRERGLKVGEQFFLAFSPERVDPGQRPLPHPEHAQDHRRRHAGLHRGGPRPVLPGLDTVIPVSSTQRRGDGEAPREHLPQREHRPRERGRAHVPAARRSTSGR